MMMANIIQAFIAVWNASGLLHPALGVTFPLIHGRAQAGDVAGSATTPYAIISVRLEDTVWYSGACIRTYNVQIKCLFGQSVGDGTISPSIAAIFSMPANMPIYDANGIPVAIVISCRPVTGDEGQDAAEQQTTLLSDVNTNTLQFTLTLGENF
jgi:hypothetical protein